MSRAVGRKSLDIPKFGRESLEMGRESLEIPKFGRQSLDMGRESLCPVFCDPCLDFHQILVCSDFRDLYPDFRAVSAMVWKVAPSPPWSEKSRCLHLGLESRTVSTSVARNIILVAPSPPRSGKSRRLSLGLKSGAVSALV